MAEFEVCLVVFLKQVEVNELTNKHKMGGIPNVVGSGHNASFCLPDLLSAWCF
jgi:hypothetical protein